MEESIKLIKEKYSNNQSIETIINNCKSNKTFLKLIILTIKLNIELFKYNNDKYELRSNEEIINDCINKKKTLFHKFSFNISNNIDNIQESNLMPFVDSEYKNLQKYNKFIDVIIFILKDIYKDDELKIMFSSDNIKVEKKYVSYPKYINLDTYIAEYSN